MSAAVGRVGRMPLRYGAADHIGCGSAPSGPLFSGSASQILGSSEIAGGKYCLEMLNLRAVVAGIALSAQYLRHATQDPLTHLLRQPYPDALHAAGPWRIIP